MLKIVKTQRRGVSRLRKQPLVKMNRRLARGCPLMIAHRTYAKTIAHKFLLRD